MAKNALGRGLGALLGSKGTGSVAPAASAPSAPEADSPEQLSGVKQVDLKRIQPCSFQPRKDFTADSLQELADSIREQGIIQPLIVRKLGDQFELIAGERRWRAAQIAGLEQVPIVVREADDRTVLEIALVENLQRENLNPMEEALGYSQLIEQFQLTQEQTSQKVGKSRAVVANALRLLRLSDEVQAYLRHGQLSVGHAKVILGVSNPADQNYIAQKTIKDSWSVRHLEDYVSHLQPDSKTKSGGPRRISPSPTPDAHVEDLESKLRERLGTKVTLRYRKGKGAVDIRFSSDDELERVLEILGVSAE
jgi:ParB family chromosome partitioning protein